MKKYVVRLNGKVLREYNQRLRAVKFAASMSSFGLTEIYKLSHGDNGVLAQFYSLEYKFKDGVLLS